MKNLRQIEAFLQDKAVNCKTEEEAAEFLNILKEKGFRWCDGEEIKSETYWDRLKDSQCYLLDKSGVWYENRRNLEMDDTDVITFDEFMDFYGDNNRKDVLSIEELRNRVEELRDYAAEVTDFMSLDLYIEVHTHYDDKTNSGMTITITEKNEKDLQTDTT